MQRLLEDFDAIVNFDLPCGSSNMGQALEELVNKAQAEPSVAWGDSGISTNISTMQRECMHYFYRPHLYPEMDEKMQLVHKLQFNLLPTFCPQKAPVQLATVLESFSHLSGDLLGWRFLPDDSFMFYILDISGHGLKAGLLSAVLKTIIDKLEMVESLEEFVGQVNRQFVRSLKEPDELYYATGVFMRIDAEGTLQYISAAHPQVFLKERGGTIHELHSTSIPIGLYENRAFECRTLPLTQGSVILLYTDGVTEAENAEGDVFGYERVRSVLGIGYEYAEEVTNGLYRALSRFQSFESLQDDVTFLAAKVK